MNEQFFLKFYMARSHIEMQRSGIEMALNNCKKEESLHQQTFLLFPVLYI